MAVSESSEKSICSGIPWTRKSWRTLFGRH